MATIASQASGNWSSTSTWAGGVLPGTGDVAQILTGHVVTVDQNIAVQTITNTGNGKLLITGSTPYTVTCSISTLLVVTATGTSLIQFDASYSATGTVLNLGAVTIGAHTGTAALAVVEVLSGATGTCDMNLVSWSADTSTAGNEPGLLVINGDVDFDVTCNGAMGSSNAGESVILITSPADLSVTALTMNRRAVVMQGATIGDVTVTITSTTGFIADNGVRVEANTTVNSLTINGNITSDGSSTYGLYAQVSAGKTLDLTINGNIYGTSNGLGSGGATLSSLGTMDVTINGNVYGERSCPGIALSGGTTTINGDVYGNGTAGNFGAGYGMNITGAIVGLTITGDVGVRLDVNGIMTSATFNQPIRIGQSGQESHLYSTSYVSAIAGAFMITDGASVYEHFIDYSPFGSFEIAPSITNAESGFDPADVRDGVSYDNGSQTGTMVVPDAHDVYFGVPVDDTVGTAALPLADAAAITGSQIAALSE